MVTSSPFATATWSVPSSGVDAVRPRWMRLVWQMSTGSADASVRLASRTRRVDVRDRAVAAVEGAWARCTGEGIEDRELEEPCSHCHQQRDEQGCYVQRRRARATRVRRLNEQCSTSSSAPFSLTERRPRECNDARCKELHPLVRQHHDCWSPPAGVRGRRPLLTWGRALIGEGTPSPRTVPPCPIGVPSARRSRASP
jgi:hypothetical protein